MQQMVVGLYLCFNIMVYFLYMSRIVFLFYSAIYHLAARAFY